MGESSKIGANYTMEPTLLVIADSDAGMARCRIAAESIEARVVAAIKPDEAGEWLNQRSAFNVAMVDIRDDSGCSLDSLLDSLETAAEHRHHSSVICAPLTLLDAIDAQISHDSVMLLCDPTDIERAGALGVAVVASPLTLHDISSERDEARLLKLNQEVARIGRMLTELSHGHATAQPISGGLSAPADGFRSEPPRSPSLSAEDIRVMIRLRRLRDRFFENELFADPAWDMLLDLMAARLEERQVAVSSLCIAASVPPTTALRWIKTMTRKGLFVRRSDPHDGRRVFIELSDEAAWALECWFAAAKREGEMASV